MAKEQQEDIRESAEAKKQEFLVRVDELLRQCEAWIRDSDPSAETGRESTQISEELVGEYEAPVLVIQRPSYTSVRLIPRGRWVIGADGRVDIVGEGTRETLVYLPTGGYHLRFTATTDSGEKLADSSQPLVESEAGAEGWHYVQSRHLRYFPILDQELFYRILEVAGR